MNSPDSIDIQIAQLLAKDARQSSEEIAKQLKISSATVRRRLRKLISSNLMRIVAVVDPGKFGLSVAAIIALDVVPDKLESTIEELANRQGVRFISTTTGRYDIIILTRFNSIEHLSGFIKKELGHLEGLRGSETFLCLDVGGGHHVQFG